MEFSSLFESYREAENMEYFQWLHRRVMSALDAATERLTDAKTWDEARFYQGQIDALRTMLATMVPDEARI